MERPFFSVIIPAYQVEEYIHWSVKSVLLQTFRDFELIIVDDCSSDRSGEIADDYEKMDNRIRVVHHEKNMGLSAARNTGMDKAAGRYILFWDSDDEVDGSALEMIYDSLMLNPAQIVVYGLIEEYYDKTQRLIHTRSIIPERKLINNAFELRKAIISLEAMTLYGYAWNKCYDLDYLQTLSLKFKDIRMIEDIQFNVDFCQNAERMNILDIVPYHYKKRVNNSLTRKFLPEYFSLHRGRISLVFEQYQDWGLCTGEVKKELGNRLVRYIYSALERNCDKRNGFGYADRKEWLERVFEDEIYTQLVPYADSDKLVLRLMNKMLQGRCIRLCLVSGRMIFIIKNKLPKAYILLQQKR